MKWVKALYFSNRFFILTGAIAALFVFSYFIAFLLPIAKALFLLWIGTAISDFGILFFARTAMEESRRATERLSNGDENEIRITPRNALRMPGTVFVIYEVSTWFQPRNLNYSLSFT